jgi:hypothetical protein
MNMETKEEIFTRYKKDYFKARHKQGKRKILTRIITNVVDVTNMNRKSVIRAFNRLQTKSKDCDDGRGRPVMYTNDVTCALKDVWEAGDEVCGELLKPMVSEYISILIRDKMWNHGDVATGKLLAMSVGTMKERVGTFFKIRNKGRSFSSTSPSLIKHIIPIFHGDWNEKLPGTGQIDTVVHCGHTLSGNMVFTLNYTDVPVLWVVLRAQWNKGQHATQESILYIQEVMPFLILELHPDSGSEFINWHLKGWCDTKNITMSRSRPNHSNDNMHVEERNGHVVRKHIGNIRLDCKEAVDALNDVYRVLCPYLNHFVASRRVIEKYEVDGKWKKKYENIAKTPYQRILENEHIPKEVKDNLKVEHDTLNPLVMKKEIDRLKRVLYATQRKYGNKEF